MLMTDAQETCTRNLRDLTCARNLYVCHADLQQDFSRASFSHQCSIWCKKLAITWLNLRTLIGYPGWAQATGICRCKFLLQKFDASFSCEFLVRVSRTSFLYVCLGHNHQQHVINVRSKRLQVECRGLQVFSDAMKATIAVTATHIHLFNNRSPLYRY